MSLIYVDPKHILALGPWSVAAVNFFGVQTVHDYAIFGHDRVAIGRWLGVASILIAGAVAQLIVIANDLTGWSGFAKATVTTGLVYLVLHWLFNRWIWKISILEIPDLSGEWDVVGRTLDEAGNVRWQWAGTIGITQNWKQILIHLKTDQSQSWSYTATLSKRHSPIGGWLLSYSYGNDPEIETSHELSAHKGYCEAEINKDITTGKIRYFNHSGRNTFGVIDIKRRAH